MENEEKSILFKQSNLFIKSTIELPPSIIFTKSVFLKQYYQNTSGSSLIIPILDIIKNNIKLHRTIKLNSYSSFANNEFYINYYRYLVKIYKEYNNEPVNNHTAYSIINYINFNIYLILALMTNSSTAFVSEWYAKQIHFKDSIIKTKFESLIGLEATFTFYLNPLILKLDSPQIFTTVTDRLIDKFSLTIMQQNDNKK